MTSWKAQYHFGEHEFNIQFTTTDYQKAKYVEKAYCEMIDSEDGQNKERPG